MSLAHGILGLLNYGDMSGYDLAKAFNSSLRFFWHAQNSQIYLTLDKLEKQGLITHNLVIQTGRPNKKVYSITEAGKKEFFSWLAGNTDTKYEIKSTFLMRIFFAGNTSKEQSINMLKRFIEDCRSFLQEMDTVPAYIEEYTQIAPDNAPLYWQFTADFGRRYVNMCIDWAENCIRKLGEPL